jgi:hypothetical protein
MRQASLGESKGTDFGRLILLAFRNRVAGGVVSILAIPDGYKLADRRTSLHIPLY